METKISAFKNPLFLILFITNTLFGITFLYSAYTKLYPIEPFEYIFIENGIGNWTTSPIMARLVIGFEFLLGFFIIINFKLQKITYRLSAAMLLFFTIYLMIYIIVVGNEGNCGCFGQAISMTPLESIYKNILMLAILIILYIFYKPIELFKTDKWTVIFIIIISILIPNILKPMDIFFNYKMTKIKDKEILKVDILYKNENPKNKIPEFDIREGKSIIAFASLTCPHCIMAIHKLNILKKDNPQFPIYYILNGEPEEINDFFKETKYIDIPYTMLYMPEFMMLLESTSLPKIFLIENGVIKYAPDYKEINEKQINEWLTTKTE